MFELVKRVINKVRGAREGAHGGDAGSGAAQKAYGALSVDEAEAAVRPGGSLEQAQRPPKSRVERYKHVKNDNAKQALGDVDIQYGLLEGAGGVGAAPKVAEQRTHKKGRKKKKGKKKGRRHGARNKPFGVDAYATPLASPGSMDHGSGAAKKPVTVESYPTELPSSPSGKEEEGEEDKPFTIEGYPLPISPSGDKEQGEEDKPFTIEGYPTELAKGDQAGGEGEKKEGGGIEIEYGDLGAAESRQKQKGKDKLKESDEGGPDHAPAPVKPLIDLQAALDQLDKELTQLGSQADAEAASGITEIQGDVSELQARLRALAAGSTHGRMENINAHMNEGWALISIINHFYRADIGKIRDSPFKTKYLYDDEEKRQGGRAPRKQKKMGRDKKLVVVKDGLLMDAKGRALSSEDAMIPGNLLHQKQLERQEQVGHKLEGEELRQFNAEMIAANGRLIWVMTGSGAFYAAESVQHVIHHSSFLAGGAIASGGDVSVKGGRIETISNLSGHYQPSPGHLWQALIQLQSQGVNLSGVKVELFGVKGQLDAEKFIRVFNPVVTPALLLPERGAAIVNAQLERAAKEPESLEGEGDQ